MRRAMNRLVCTCLFLTACIARHPGGDDAASPDAGSADAGGGPTLAERVAAAEAAAGGAACVSIKPFYWEIGDKDAPLASGSFDTQADTAMDIASASKFLFGAYVVELNQHDLSQIDHRAMTMGSGYVHMDYLSCVHATTVDDCLSRNNNDVQETGDLDRFFYNSGHFQHYASAALGLGPDDDAALAIDIGDVLGNELGIAYSSPQLAAGGHMSASDYARFLRKILAGGLAIRDALGADAVCTRPGKCPGAIYSPAPYAWHYSYGHWVEDDASIGDDGAFSSPGAFGFYPWIDASKTYYGIVAREDKSSLNAYVDSAVCGRAIRKAFLTGTAGTAP